jgi:hypothetical protein
MVPCTIVPNEIYKINVMKDPHVRVIYDSTKFETFNVTIEELRRYSSELVPLIEVYPNTTSEELTYAGSGLYDSASELVRFETLINMITDVSKLKSDVFYTLAEFISYELLFRYLTSPQRLFMMSLAASLIEDPITESMVEHCNTPMINMTKRIFDKFPNIPGIHKIVNYKHFGNLSHITFPILLNITNLKANVYAVHEVLL